MFDLLPNFFRAETREELNIFSVLLSWDDELWAVPKSFPPGHSLLYAAAWTLERGLALEGWGGSVFLQESSSPPSSVLSVPAGCSGYHEAVLH